MSHAAPFAPGDRPTLSEESRARLDEHLACGLPLLLRPPAWTTTIEARRAACGYQLQVPRDSAAARVVIDALAPRPHARQDHGPSGQTVTVPDARSLSRLQLRLNERNTGIAIALG